MSALRKHFSFDVNLQQAYKSPEGKMHVVGIASDDMEDRTGDRMSDKAIKSMVQQAKKNRLPLLDNHRSTFGFGKTYDASARTVVENGKKVTQFVVDFELDDRYPQASDLYEEVEAGNATKQLSIGGFLPTDNPKAVSFERQGKKMIRRIDDIMLEHIATTRPNMAAVPRTKFVNAVVKDIFGTDEGLPEAWHQEVGEQIERQVDQGATEGVADTPDGPVDFQLLQKQDEGKHKTVVVMVNMPPSSWSEKTVTATDTDESDVTLEDHSFEEETSKETTEEASKDEAETQEEKSMADTEQSTVDQPKAGEDHAAIRGLSVLAQIGKAFDESNKSKDTTEDEGHEKGNTEAEIEVQEEVSELAKTFDAIEGLELNEKSAAEVKRIMAGMAKLLDLEVGDERADTDSAFSAKSAEQLTSLVEKSVAQAFEAAYEAKAEEKSAADVIVVFEKSFEGLTNELAKGLVDMAEGFKTQLNKSVEGMQEQIAQLEKSSDERLAKLEKAAGVRQSIPAQEPAVATGAQTAQTAQVATQVPGTQVAKSARAPDQRNPFRGLFDGARAAYLSQHR